MKSPAPRLQVISNALLLLSAITFIAFYLIISFYNRPVADDILNYSLLKEKGITEATLFLYNNWSGRWTGSAYFMLVFNTSTTFRGCYFFIFLYYLLTLLLFIYSASSIIRFAGFRLFNSIIDVKSSVIYSAVLFACFYYFTFQPIEAWWWISGSFFYLQGIVFLQLGLAFVLKENKTIFHYIIISISFIYVGGAYELYVLIVLTLFAIMFIYFLTKRNSAFFSFKQNKIVKALVVAFISMAIASCIAFSSPGNIKRKAFENSVSTAANTEISTPGFSFSSATFLQKKYILAIGIASLWFLLGMKLKARAQTYSISLKKVLVVASVPLLVSVLITILFQVFVLPAFPVPLRGYTFTSFALSILCCLGFLTAGFTFHLSLPFIYFFRIIIPSILLLILSFSLFSHYTLEKTYSRKYDLLIDKIMDAKSKNQTEPLLLNDLPEPGALTRLDLEDSYNTLIPLQKIFKAAFEIRKAE